MGMFYLFARANVRLEMLAILPTNGLKSNSSLSNDTEVEAPVRFLVYPYVAGAY